MQMADLLIRTKLRPPSTRTTLVPRPRLQEQVTQGLRGPLTLITAPAGFGKTTLATEWLYSKCDNISSRAIAWLSLDEADNDLHLFLSYVVAAALYCSDSTPIPRRAATSSGLSSCCSP